MSEDKKIITTPFGGSEPSGISTAPLEETNENVENENTTNEASSESSDEGSGVGEQVGGDIKEVSQENEGGSETTGFESQLFEKSGGKYKSWEDLQKIIDEKPIDLKFENDTSKKVFDYIKSGKIDDVMDILYEQKVLSNIGELDDKEVIRLKIAYENSDYTQEDISDEFVDAYGFKGDEDDSGEVDKYNRMIKRTAKKAREFLLSQKQDIILPDITPQNQPQQEEIPVDTEGVARMRQSWLSSLDTASNDFKGFKFDLKDKGVSGVIEYPIESTEAQSLKSKLTSYDYMAEFESRYIQGDKYDAAKLMKDMYIRDNFEKIVSAAVTQALSKGKLETLGNIKNINLNQQSSESFVGDKESEEMKMAKFYFKN